MPTSTCCSGFHLGQFTLPDDKRLPYEFDIRVPLIVRPPTADGWSMRSGASSAISNRNSIVLNIDLGPTLLDIAGLETPSYMDGSSYKSLVTAGTAGHGSNVDRRLRTDFLVEYHGEYGGGSDGQYARLKPPLFHTPPFFSLPPGVTASKMQDCRNNTYSCLRSLSGEDDTIYCQFYSTDASWTAGSAYDVEYYNLTADPHQMDNIAGGLSPARSAALVARLDQLRGCTGGAACL